MPDNKLRLLYASERPFFPLRLGGAARSSDALIRMLVKDHGAECMALTTTGGGGSRIPDAAEYDVLGIKGLERNGEELLFDCGYENRMVAREVFYESLESAIRFFKPTVIWSQLEGMKNILKLGVRLGIPGIVYIRDSVIDARGLVELAELGVEIVCQSRFLVDKVKQLCNVEASLAYSIYESEVGAQGDPQGYLTMINPAGVKGIGTFLSFAKLMPEEKFLLVEGWSMTTEMRDWIEASLRELPNVRFMHHVADIREIYSQTRLLLVPSVWEEAVPRVVREAQSCGVPSIASKRGALPEAVGDGGLIVEDFLNPRKWVEAINAMRDETTYATAVRNARMRWEDEQFNPQTNVQRFIAACGIAENRLRQQQGIGVS